MNAPPFSIVIGLIVLLIVCGCSILGRRLFGAYREYKSARKYNRDARDCNNGLKESERESASTRAECRDVLNAASAEVGHIRQSGTEQERLIESADKCIAESRRVLETVKQALARGKRT